ncbi:MAG: phosphate ABC transporter ATP-binding protein [Firmicutes bacterium]|nr:phosphate ABC transporter ATP-binding protein [Bacillota bacterium]
MWTGGESAAVADGARAPVLRVANITLTVGKTVILRDLYLELPAGTVTALVGPSGSGKSSLLRVLNRMWDGHPDARVSGQVWFRGINLYSRGIDVSWVRRSIGLVFQRPTPFPRSIYENIALPLRIHGAPRSEIADRVRLALEQAALWNEVEHRLHAPAESLSGGQQQRLCIARALAVGPEVLMLDEPASALDPASRARIEELILSLKRQVTILLVTHHLDQAQKVADYTGVLLQGELQAWGRTDEVFSQQSETAVYQYLHPEPMA